MIYWIESSFEFLNYDLHFATFTLLNFGKISPTRRRLSYPPRWTTRGIFVGAESGGRGASTDELYRRSNVCRRKMFQVRLLWPPISFSVFHYLNNYSCRQLFYYDGWVNNYNCLIFLAISCLKRCRNNNGSTAMPCWQFREDLPWQTSSGSSSTIIIITWAWAQFNLSIYIRPIFRLWVYVLRGKK